MSLLVVGLNHRTAHVELHFRRLAILDLDQRSDQPFGDPGTGVTVYNGELYNA